MDPITTTLLVAAGGAWLLRRRPAPGVQAGGAPAEGGIPTPEQLPPSEPKVPPAALGGPRSVLEELFKRTAGPTTTVSSSGAGELARRLMAATPAMRVGDVQPPVTLSERTAPARPAAPVGTVQLPPPPPSPASPYRVAVASAVPVATVGGSGARTAVAPAPTAPPFGESL